MEAAINSSGLSGRLRPYWFAVVAGLLVLSISACGRDGEAPAPVRSHLQGRLTVDPEVDPTPDYAGFEVLVISRSEEGSADTLGYAVTDSTGRFATEVAAPERGIYPVLIHRRGELLKVGELAVTAGDSAVVTAQFPMGNRMLNIRSQENAAWMAYKNTKAQHNAALMRMLQGGTYDAATVARNVAQASAILWSLRDNYRGTIGAEIGAAEAVMMLEGWNDSLAVARAREIEPSNPNYVDVARAARRSQARLGGQAAALELLRAFQAEAASAEQKAGLQSEVVVAYADSLRREEAVAAAEALKRDYPKTAWAAWADRAIYEIERLSPGMPAPEFLLVDRDGNPITLKDFAGRLLLLEFYRPEDAEYERQLPVRNALYEAVGRDSMSIVSISLQPDTLLNDAFLEGRTIPGRHIVAPAGEQSQVARNYNVHMVPTRVLIDREGRIVRKYVGGTMSRLQDDLAELLTERRPPA